MRSSAKLDPRAAMSYRTRSTARVFTSTQTVAGAPRTPIVAATTVAAVGQCHATATGLKDRRRDWHGDVNESKASDGEAGEVTACSVLISWVLAGLPTVAQRLVVRRPSTGSSSTIPKATPSVKRNQRFCGW